MPIDPRFKVTGQGLKRDVRPWTVRFVDWLKTPEWFASIQIVLALHLIAPDAQMGRGGSSGLDLSWTWPLADVFLLIGIWYFRWFRRQLVVLPLKLPQHAGDMKEIGRAS